MVYASKIREIFEEVYDVHVAGTLELSQRLICVIRTHLVHLFGIMDSTGKTPQTLHVENLAATSSLISWRRLRSNKTCLFCNARPPEHVLDCRHAMCDRCVKGLGEAQLDREYCYRLNQCDLCLKPANLTVYLKPPTAGVRLISVDGGGIRVIVPLGFLEVLQSSFGDECQLQDFFDLAFGTSAGKSINAMTKFIV